MAPILAGCAAPHRSSPESFGDHDRASEHVSLIQLIANPSAFHGKKVAVEGVIKLEFEGNALYLCKEAFAYGISKHAVWVSLDENALGAPATTIASLNGRYVLVEGTFDSAHLGHMRLFTGAIDHITRVTLWEWTR